MCRGLRGGGGTEEALLPWRSFRRSASVRRGYRAGRFSLLELADAQLQLIEVEREATEAAARFHTLMVDIQRIVGAP